LVVFKALLVGNAHFSEDPHGLGTLNGPLNDVDALRAELTNPETGLFECQPPLKDAPAQSVLDTTDEFFRNADRDDVLLFYYSGHGRIDLSNEFYLCARDTNTQDLASPRIPGPALSKFVRLSPARLKILILDCCYASEYKGGVWSPKYFRGEGRFVLAAARRGSPLVPDAAGSGELSPFTKLLVDALRRGDLDVDGDGFITAHDVAQHITELAGTRSAAPFALQQWTGAGIVPIARTAKRAGDTSATAEDLVVVAPPSSAGGQRWPEMVPLPSASEPEFWLSRALVTNAQFRAFLNEPANAGWRPATARRAGKVGQDYLRTWGDIGADPERDNHPVVQVDLAAVMAYLDWVSRQTGQALRLPRESEWLHGARAGRTGNWHLEDARAGLVNYRDTLGEITEVGEFHANPYGMCDLLGQVWEICLTDTGEPVLRGGAFNTPAARLLERGSLPAHCRGDVGFRCASDGVSS
jgi:formylglycine-generating enzyme